MLPVTLLHSHHTMNIGFKFRKFTQSWGGYPTLEGPERYTLIGGALGHILGFFDRGTPAGCRLELAWKLE